MSVYKPPKSPFYHYDFKIDGHRIHGSTGQKRKRAAEAVRDQVRAEAKDGHDPRKDLTLDKAAGDYWLFVNKDPKIKYQIDRLVGGLGRTTLVSRITAGMVSDYAEEAATRLSRRGGRISNASVNREVELLRRIVYRAKKKHQVRIQDIEWKEIRLREPKGKERVLTFEEEDRLMIELAPHLRAPVRFSLLTGLRKANVLELDWSQVSLADAVMRLTVKGGKAVTLPLTGEVVALLSTQGPKEEGRVFTKDGAPLLSVKTGFSGALRRAKIKDFRWHDLRHTTASRMVAAGIDISLVQEAMTHEDITTTRRYVHHTLDDIRRAMESLSRTIPEMQRKDGAK